jgi:uncharacterized protein
MSQELTDNTDRSRYEYSAEGAISFIDYRRSSGVVALTHAEVPRELEGRGVGSRMARAVLDAIRARGEKVIPQCSFVAAFIRRHPEYQDLVASR